MLSVKRREYLSLHRAHRGTNDRRTRKAYVGGKDGVLAWRGDRLSQGDSGEVFQTTAAANRLEGLVVAWDPGPTELSCVHRRSSR